MDFQNVILIQRGTIGHKETSLKDFSFHKEDNPLVSLIIYTENNYKNTKSCLNYLYKNTENIPYEVILADDNSKDETINIPKEIGNIKLIKNSTKLGFIKNINNASKLAKGKYICLLNSNMIPQKDWLKNLLQIIEENGNVGIVGAKILSSDNKPVRSYFFLDDKGYLREENNSKELNASSEVDYCSSALLLIKKEAFEKIGGFDESLIEDFYKDANLSFAFKHILELKTIYQPKSEVITLKPIDNNPELFVSDNRIPFYLKWKQYINFEKNKDREGIDIHICFGFTDNYTPFTGCTIASILINSDLNDRYHFYLLSDYLSKEHKLFFERLKTIRDFKISFFNIDNNEFEGVKIFEFWGISTYYRFKIFEAIKADKGLYLDSDMLVKDDLHELFETDIGNYLCAGVSDRNEKEEIKRLFQFKESSIYINGGVELFNLKKCRDNNIESKLFNLAKTLKNDYCVDQDIVNLVLQNKIKKLDTKWNTMHARDIEEYNSNKDFYDNQVKKSVIEHYTPEKPWNNSSKAYNKEEYLEYFRFTIKT